MIISILIFFLWGILGLMIAVLDKSAELPRTGIGIMTVIILLGPGVWFLTFVFYMGGLIDKMLERFDI